MDILRGVNILHESGVVHRDLKVDNVLLDSSLRAKIADFGLSRTRDSIRSQSVNTQAGTYAYIAPELLFDPNCKPSTACDMYSCGVILWEIASREFPWGGANPACICGFLMQQKRPELPSDCPQAFVNAITRCWHQDPTQRPSANEAYGMIERGMLEANFPVERAPPKVEQIFHVAQNQYLAQRNAAISLKLEQVVEHVFKEPPAMRNLHMARLEDLVLTEARTRGMGSMGATLEVPVNWNKIGA